MGNDVTQIFTEKNERGGELTMAHEISHPQPRCWTFKTPQFALAFELGAAAQKRGLDYQWGRNEAEGRPEEFFFELWNCPRTAFSAILQEATQAMAQMA
jgi:hypothetical protein